MKLAVNALKAHVFARGSPFMHACLFAIKEAVRKTNNHGVLPLQRAAL